MVKIWTMTKCASFFGDTVYMAVNEMSNLIDFEQMQTILIPRAYARIKTFFSIACSYFDDKIINVKTPNFCHR